MRNVVHVEPMARFVREREHALAQITNCRLSPHREGTKRSGSPAVLIAD
jgi:hypothetical protein